MVLGCTLATFCTLFYWLVPPIHGAKIGVVPPIMFESHLYIFQHLAHTLHHKGHTMVFIVSEGRNVPNSPIFRVQRYPGLFDSNSADAFLQTKVQNILSGRLTSLELLDILDHYSKNCDIMMGNADLLGRLQHEAFDLILVDPNEICGFVLAHVLGVPHAMFSTGLWFPAEIGAPAPLSYVPEFNSELTDEMGLWQRLKNGAFYIVSRIGTRWLIFPRYDRILAQHNTVPALPMATIIEKSVVFMLCTDLALEFPRPTLPHIVYVGGVLTRPAQLLPQVFSEWAKASGPNGFVLVSFGAGIKHLSNELTNTFAGALAQLPYQVIWRYFGKSPKNLGNNTWLVEWVPQNDLLGHPNARAFISHGGLNGIYEAVYHSVPVVGLPIFGDHYDTMTRVHAKGMGIKLDWRRLTEQKLAHTIITVASDSRYKEKAVLLSRIYRDQEHPVKRAVHWIEYVLRHDGAPHLRPRVYDLSFYTYFLLDLLAIGVCFGLFLGWAGLVFLRWRSLRAPSRLQASSACCNGDGGQTGHALRQKLD